MNIAFEEGIQASIINLAHNERSPNKVPASKSKQLRLDSPTTISACEELGLLIDDLKQKPIEDFKDPNVDENIVQIRYNHYLKRFNQAIKDVTTRKRRIARRIRNQQLEQQQLEQHSPEILRTRTAGSPEIQNYMAGSVSFMRSPNSVGFSPLAMSITPMADTVNKTIGYFRKSHAVPIVKDLGQIIGKEEDQEEESEDPVKKLERTLSQEVDRFNRAKKTEAERSERGV